MWTDLSVNVTANMTKFEQIQEISGQPYYTAGFLLIAALALIFAFLIGISHVSRTSRKSCFSSSIYWKFVTLNIIVIAIVGLIWFFLPVHLAWLGG